MINERKELIYESIIHDMSEGVMMINLDGIVESINPAAEKILGKKKDEVLGQQYVRMFIRDIENDVFNQSVLDALYDPTARHEKIVPWYNDGQVKQLYMVTSFLFREDQKIGTIIVFGDITELSELKVRYAKDIETLLDSLVRALSTAIDERSHYNANHTRNMVKMAEAFLDWMESQGNPWQYDEIRRRVFIMSVGLHDIGKLSVPLEIMDKATRLGPKLETIRDRFARLRLISRIAMLEGRITDAEYEKTVKEAEDNLAFICHVNQGGFLLEDDLQRVRELGQKTFEDEDGERKRLLTDEEVTMLSIRKGTLTDGERRLMQGHASSTWNILSQVCFPEQYADVPVWASAHHELLNATGYTKHLSGPDIPKEVRLLTILDIFEALTARDRPYKAPIPIEKAWTILENMVRDGALDGDLLAEFRESRAWARVIPSSNPAEN